MKRVAFIHNTIGLGLAACVAACGASSASSQGVSMAAAPASPASAAVEDAPAVRADGELVTHPIDVMPVGLTTIGATALGRDVYVLGGYAGAPHAYSQRDQSREFYRLNLDSHAWEKLPSLGPIQSAVLVNDGRYVYRVGGMIARNDAGQPEDMHSLADVTRFDPEKNVWEPLASLPEPRSSHYAVIHENTLIVVGGWSLHGGSYDSEYQQTLARCDLGQPQCTWTTEPMPFASRAHGAAVHDGKLYVLGGLTPEGSSDAVHVYDLKSRTWSPGPALPKGNLTICAATMGGQLYANGGDGKLYRLSADGAAWQAAGALAFPRMFHAMIEGPSGLLALGGIPSGHRGARVRHIEEVRPAPSLGGVMWTLDAESPAKNRQGAFLLGQQLYVFGGNNSLAQHDFEPTNFVKTARRLDLGTLEWKPVEDFPVARQSMQTLIGGSDDKPMGLVIGGFGITEGRTSSQPEVFGYDFAAGRWSAPLTRLPVARSQFGLVEWNGAAWVIGGLSFDGGRKGGEFQLPSALLRLDLEHPEAGFGEAGFTLAEARRAFAGGLLGDRYYVTGGMKQNFEPVTRCEVLDLKAQTSTAMSCPSRTRIGGELVPIGDVLYLVGGSAVPEGGGDPVPTAHIEAYDPATDQWRTITETLPFEDPNQLRAFAYRGRLLLYSAQRSTPTVQVALLDPLALAAGERRFASIAVPKAL